MLHEEAKESNMVRTYGLTHINLLVRDVERSLPFYKQVFGVEEYGRTEGLVPRQDARLPGCDHL
jgi:catechol 2,3-dioxygenase-like lactoylglutathione lyase family enzyme